MKVPAAFRLGSATHTGLVRTNNEDDYLVLAPPDRRPVTLLVAIADGMGGVVGGAEASRTALRGLATGLLEVAVTTGTAPADELLEQTAAGFRAAWARVREQARLLPALREMGTTLTALVFAGDHAVLAHIGDSRAYLLRGGELRLLTTDHTAQAGGNQLLRCIGGGLEASAPDLQQLDLAPGDRFLLCSDGVWGTVPPPRLHELLRLPPPVAAERLIALALAAGGPDNATAVVVQFLGPGGEDTSVDQPLPREESRPAAELAVHRARIGAPRWPWLVLVAVAVLLGSVAANWLYGFDPVAWLRSFG